MELRHLRYFVATVDAGSVSAAAQQVHVTQPALSRQLRQLEGDLGVTLFDRAGGRLTLSRIGRELLPQARALLDRADSLRADAAFYADGGLRRLTIAAPTVTLTDVVSPFVAEMAPTDPVVDVRTSDGLTSAAMLDAGADLVIGTQLARRPLVSRPLAVLPVWAYVPPSDPWATAGEITLDALLTRPMIVLPSTYTAREALEAAVRTAAGSFPDVLEAANGTVAQALAAAGRGTAVVTDDPRFDLVPLRVRIGADLLSIHLAATWDARSAAARELEAVAERLDVWIHRRYVESRGR